MSDTERNIETAARSGSPRKAVTDWRSLHLWQIQPVRDLLLVAAVFGILYLGYLLSIVTVPMLLALLLAYLFEPVVAKLTKVTGLARNWAAVIIIVMSFFVIVTPVAIGVTFAAGEGVKFVQRMTVMIGKVRASKKNPENEELRQEINNRTWMNIRDYLVEQEARKKALEQRSSGADAPQDSKPPSVTPSNHEGVVEEAEQPAVLYQLYEWAEEKLQANAEAIGKTALQGGAGVASVALRAATTLGNILFAAFLIGFFFFFFCTGYGRVLRFWNDLIPEKKKGKVVDMLGQMDKVIAGFVRGRLTICACLMVVYSVGFWTIGVPAALILGPIVAILSIVPYLALAGIPIASLLMALDPGGGFQSAWWWILGAPWLIFAVGQFLDDWVLTPRIQGKTTNMETPTILFASLAGGALAGVYGLLIAIPVAACIKIVAKEIFVPRFKAWSSGKVRDPLPIGDRNQ